MRVLEMGIYQGLPYLVLPYPLGLNLEQLLQAGKRFGWMEVANLLNVVAHGLEYMHCLGLVHGAVRPSAVWVGADGQARLAGFTAGWLLDDRITKKDSIVFLAPEQVSGGVVDLRADIYALGMVMEKSQDKFSLYGEEMQDRVEKFCKKALSIDPAGRFQSLEEMIPRLEEIGGIMPPWNSRLLRMLDTNAEHVHSVAFSPDGKILAAGGDTGVRLWRVRDGELLRTLEPDALVDLDCIAFNPEGTLLVSGGYSPVRLWRVCDGELLRTFEPVSDGKWGMCKVVLSPDGTIIASGKSDIVYMWQVCDGQLLRRLQGHTMSVHCVAFSPDGTILASVDMDGTILLWEVRDGRLLRTLDRGSPIKSIAFSPDGTILASGDVNGNVCLWQVRDGELLQKFEPYFLDKRDEEGYQYTDYLDSIAFSPDGTILASVGYNNVLLWRLRYGQLLQVLEGDQASGEIVAFNPDGTILAVGGYDGIVRLWEMQI